MRIARAAAVLLALGVALAGTSAGAATLCVSAAPQAGCYTTISDAITAANDGDVIAVGEGTYAESLWIGKSVSLVGAGPKKTTIDATGLPYGILAYGYLIPGFTGIRISGFTVANSNAEG